MGTDMGVANKRPIKSRKRKNLKTIITTTVFIVVVVCLFIFRDRIAAVLPFEISDTVTELIMLRRG